jgi:hypothetical protein
MSARRGQHSAVQVNTYVTARHEAYIRNSGRLRRWSTGALAEIQALPDAGPGPDGQLRPAETLFSRR